MVNGGSDGHASRLTAYVETQLGALSAPIVVADRTANGQIAISAISLGGNRVTARAQRLCAIPPDGSPAKYTGTIADNVTQTHVLDLAASSLGAGAPTVNTTIDPEILNFISAARERCEDATDRRLITQQWEYSFDRFPQQEDFVEFPLAPVISIDYIKYIDMGGVTARLLGSIPLYRTHYPVGANCPPGMILSPPLPRSGHDHAFLRNAARSAIGATVGYGPTPDTVPNILRATMLMDISTMDVNRMRNRDDVSGMSSAPEEFPWKTYFNHRVRWIQELVDASQ